MFEDVDDQLKSGFRITPEASDRAVVYAIWSRNEVGHLAVADAWKVLSGRYPSEPRFVLFHSFAELALPHPSGAHGWSPTSFLDEVQRMLDTAGGKLNPEVRDLLAMAEDELHQLSETDAARLDRIRTRVGMRATGDATAARKRLARLVVDFVRDLHERTLGGKDLGGGGGTDWKSAVASATGPARPYAATDKVSAGDLVVHAKFGVGFVTAVEPGRAHILFESGSRKLLCG
jgi:hypothetical protein